MNHKYPFTAISGQQQAKIALLLNCIHPTIGGVLLSGEKGTAKSTMVRAIAQLLPEQQVLTLPLAVTEDMLLGNIDVEATVKTGILQHQPGLLARANGQILYIDEINLLSESVLNLILDVAASGVFHIEREGISGTCKSQFILLASMNPEEGALRPQILDRFGFFVELKASNNERERVEIMKNRLLFEENSAAFYARYLSDEKALSLKIDRAKSRLKETNPSDDVLKQIAQICERAFVAGHRGDLALLRGAIAHASFNERTVITRADIAAIQALALAHRIRNTQSNPPPESDEQPDQENQDPKSPSAQTNEQQPQQEDENNNETESEASPNEGKQDFPVSIGEDHFDLSELKLSQDILTPKSDRKIRNSGSGKRCITRSGTKQGRYVKAIIPKAKVLDLAFDATLRAAAPFQSLRKKNGMALVIQTEDIREKRRERRIGNSVLFLVDASGSMGIQHRMSEAKAAVLEMLKLSYTKRDVVGMMTFRQDGASLILPPTRSISKAASLLRDIKTGGRTPLAEGLRSADRLMQGLIRKNTEIMPIVVVFSDGRANFASCHESATAETQELAQSLSTNTVRYIVVDTESGFIKLGFARKLAQWLDARYYLLSDIKQHNIQSIINQ